jgi:hypothetical protein
MGRIIEPKPKPHHGDTEKIKILPLMNTDDTDKKTGKGKRLLPRINTDERGSKI